MPWYFGSSSLKVRGEMHPAFMGTSVLKDFKTLKSFGSRTLEPSAEFVTIKANSFEIEKE